MFRNILIGIAYFIGFMLLALFTVPVQAYDRKGYDGHYDGHGNYYRGYYYPPVIVPYTAPYYAPACYDVPQYDLYGRYIGSIRICQ